METIQFTGTENQLYNLQNAIECTDNETPQESETRVYVVDLNKTPDNIDDARELNDEQFMSESERQGLVYTLQG